MAWRYDDRLVKAGLCADLSTESPRHTRLVEPQDLHHHGCVSTAGDRNLVLGWGGGWRKKEREEERDHEREKGQRAGREAKQPFL